jgi:hypothetical protein
MSALPQTLAFLFDLGGEPPPSFYYFHGACLFLSLIPLPIGYFFLCRKMALAAVPRPPTVPYFCAFGAVGGYLLLTALSPSFFTLLGIVFVPAALLSLVGSLIYVLRCRPFTPFHRGAAIACASLLLLPLLAPLFLSFLSLLYSALK